MSIMEPVFEFDSVFPDPREVWHSPAIKSGGAYESRYMEFGEYLKQYAVWLHQHGCVDVKARLREIAGVDWQNSQAALQPSLEDDEISDEEEEDTLVPIGSKRPPTDTTLEPSSKKPIVAQDSQSHSQIDPLLLTMNQVRPQARLKRPDRFCFSCDNVALFVAFDGRAVCSKHQTLLPGKLRRIHMLCYDPECLLTANFMCQETGGKYCSKHCTNRTKHLYNACFVDGCAKSACWRFFNSRNTRCSEHRLKGMISGKMTCEHPGCSQLSEFGTSVAEIKFCRIHAGVGMRGPNGSVYK